MESYYHTPAIPNTMPFLEIHGLSNSCVLLSYLDLTENVIEHNKGRRVRVLGQLSPNLLGVFFSQSLEITLRTVQVTSFGEHNGKRFA